MTRMVQDRVASHNERVKLLAGFVNAIGIALLGVGALAPTITFLGQPGSTTLNLSVLTASTALGVALHLLAHYVLTYLKKAVPNDPD